MTSVFIKRKILDTDAHTQGETQANREAKIEVMHVRAKEGQRVPAYLQKLRERHRTESPSQPPAGTNTLSSDF